MYMDRRPFNVVVAAVALSVFLIIFPVVLSAGNASTTTDGLCSSFIEPSGYICSEHTVRTYIFSLHLYITCILGASSGSQG